MIPTDIFPKITLKLHYKTEKLHYKPGEFFQEFPRGISERIPVNTTGDSKIDFF